MSEWITHRPPTEEDARPAAGLVWTIYNGKTFPWNYDKVEEGTPWMRMIVPEPYVKPKRWKAVYRVFTAMGQAYASWVIIDSHTYNEIRTELWKNTDEHRKAAERIAAIYEEEMP